MRIAPIALSFICSIATTTAAIAQDPAIWQREIEAVMQDYDVPGLAVAVVKDGEVVMARGFGVRNLGQNDPVDEHTLFGIASNTKAFTATALALLVEDGLIEWDEPVITYLPWFRLSDPWVTAQITIRDLLVHRSGLGLGSGDLLWWPASTYNRREIVERLRFLPLVTSFRSAYAYDNVLYAVAGEVILEMTGRTWEEFVQERILDHIGMTDSRIRHPGIGSTPNISGTHALVDGRIQAVTAFTSDNTNPAGGINASATDIARWMMVQLDSGRVDGAERLFSPNTARQLWQIVTPLGDARPPAHLAPLATKFRGYALGFNVQDYRGYKLVTHTGGLPGFISRVALIPELRLGVAVFTNHESPAMNPITWNILDDYMGADFDWRGGFKQDFDAGKARTAAADAAAASSRDSTALPALPLSSYARQYQDQWYGPIDIADENGKLVIRFGKTPMLVGDLTHWQYETFLVRWRMRELRADAFITFVLGPDGAISEARMAPASPSVDFSFDFADLRLVPVD